MLSSNYNYQYIDWSHGPINDENFDHLGNLVTNIFSPTLTLGLTNYFNISFTQTMGIRSMDWWGDKDSKHHRDEHSLDDFLFDDDVIGAVGSIWGDATILLKYLLTNTGLQSGSRIFIGSGIIIPSNSVLTVSPFEKDSQGNALNDHRHFSLSDGVYKYNLEFQLYMKATPKNKFMPVFYGITINYLHPIKESKYKYLPGDTYILNASSLFTIKSNNTIIPNGLSLGIIYVDTGYAYWDNLRVDNSLSNVILPTAGLIWTNNQLGAIGLNIRYNNAESVPDDVLNNQSKSIEISIGYRKTLNYIIPWLDL